MDRQIRYKEVILLLIIFAMALGVRAYQLSFFEFHDDQYTAMLMGYQTKQTHFLVTHGQHNGAGFNSPPGFAYIMGLLTTFSSDPSFFVLCYFCLNLLALAIAFIYFYRTLPITYAALSAAFLAILPAFNIYADILWEQCTLPFIMIFFHISCYRLVKDNETYQFITMCVLASLAASIHCSGFFVFPFLILLGVSYRRKIGLKIFLWALVLVFLIFLPYLVHLFVEKEVFNLFSCSVTNKRSLFQWKIFPNLFKVGSFEFMRGYFKFDFYQILNIVAGRAWMALYFLTAVTGILFIIGCLIYIKWLLKGRLFDLSQGNNGEYPIPFQISGLLIVTATLGFLVLRVSSCLHYCIVLFPALSVISGHAAFRIWQYSLGKLAVVLSLISSYILFAGILVFLANSGGHPYEYGVSYGSLRTWKQELQSRKRPGECFDLKVDLVHQGYNPDEPAILSVLKDQCEPKDKIIPIKIIIIWNDKDKRYEHIFSNL